MATQRIKVKPKEELFKLWGHKWQSRALRRAVESVSHLRGNTFGDAGGWECHVLRWPCQTLSFLVQPPTWLFLPSIVSFPFKPNCINFLVPSFHHVTFLLTVLPHLLVPYSIVSNSSLWLSPLYNMLLLFIIYFHKQFSLEPSLSCKDTWYLGPRSPPLP